MKHRAILLTLALALLFGANILTFGQSVRGRIEGTVKDPQGQVVPNVTLTITNTGTGETLKAVSTEEGAFVVAEVKPGTYQVLAEGTGFKKITIEGIVVQVATVSNVNVNLEVGNVNEQVTVNADQAQEVINTSNPEIGDVVDRQRILDLPLDGRNPFELTALQAGVQTKTSSDGEVSKFSINGNRTVANNLTVDGVDASDNFLKTPANITLGVIPVSVESIGEFRVTTSLPSAEFGRGTAQINAITASGTNKFRGSILNFIETRFLTPTRFSITQPSSIPQPAKLWGANHCFATNSAAGSAVRLLKTKHFSSFPTKANANRAVFHAIDWFTRRKQETGFSVI